MKKRTALSQPAVIENLRTMVRCDDNQGVIPKRERIQFVKKMTNPPVDKCYFAEIKGPRVRTLQLSDP